MRIPIIIRRFCSNSADSLVVTQRFKAVSIISLNRPDKENALNIAMLNELAVQLDEFEKDKSASVAVISGTGKSFSTGYDMEEMRNRREQLNIGCDSLIFPFERKTNKPIICAVSGICRSIGFEIALMCDMRYIETDTIFGFSNRYLGIPLMNSGPSNLARWVGHSKATEIILRDLDIAADEAIEIGLATKCVPNGTALGSAIKDSVHISSVPQSALHYDLNTLNKLKINSEIHKELWHQISMDITNNINNTQESLKTERVAKLQNMPEWELDEVRRENEYLARTQNPPKDEQNSHKLIS